MLIGTEPAKVTEAMMESLKGKDSMFEE